MVPQKINKIYLLTHGGLGNQLFQLNYALLLAKMYNAKICLFHSDKYYHGMKLSENFKPLVCKKKLPLIFRFRFIKVLNKFNFLGKTEKLKIGKNMYLDGYFQEIKIYNCFSVIQKLNVLNYLRRLLNIDNKVSLKGRLRHIRVGDFFNNQKQKENHIHKVLLESKSGDQFITNEEILIDSMMRNLNIFDRKIVPSNQLTDVEILKLMASFELVQTNGSTLATWAMILGKGKLESDQKQMNLRSLF